MISKKFYCENCKQSFDKRPEAKWSEKDRLQEHKDIYGFEAIAEDTAVICDDCHKQIVEWLNNLTPEERAELEAERQAALSEKAQKGKSF